MHTTAATLKVTSSRLADHITNPALRDALNHPAYINLIDNYETTCAATDKMKDAPHRDALTYHNLLDRSRVLRDVLVAQRLTNAHLIKPLTNSERTFNLPAGVTLSGQAEPGTVEWLKMRQNTVGGSDVGAICKVGDYGKYAYDETREQKMDRDPQPQAHTGAALVGDLWEPELIRIASSLLNADVHTNKGTYVTDDGRNGNLDGFTLTPEGDIHMIVECKTSNKPADWIDAPPPSYVLQAQHYIKMFNAAGALILANINDRLLVAYLVTADSVVPAGPHTNKTFGASFSYGDVEAYVKKMVRKWAGDREKGEPVVTRRSRTVTDDVAKVWRTALDKGVVFVDLETTTLSARTGHVLEAAFVDESGSVLHRLFDVTDDHFAWNGTGPVEVHGITRADVAGAPVLLESAVSRDEIAAFVGDRVLVAHNARFEESWLSEAGVKGVQYLDSMVPFAALVKDAALTDNSMETLCSWAGVEYRDAHRALPDARMLAAAWPMLRERMAEFMNG